MSCVVCRCLVLASDALRCCVHSCNAPHLLQNEPHAAMMEYKRAEKMRHNGNFNHAPLLAQAALHYTNGDLSQSIQL